MSRCGYFFYDEKILLESAGKRLKDVKPLRMITLYDLKTLYCFLLYYTCLYIKAVVVVKFHFLGSGLRFCWLKRIT